MSAAITFPLSETFPHADVLPFEERRWLRWGMLAVDVVMLEISLLLGLLLRQVFLPPTITLAQLSGMALGILLVPAVRWALGLYPGYAMGPVENLRRRSYVVLGVFAALIIWDNLVLRGAWSRGVLLFAVLFALMLPPLAEAMYRGMLVRRGAWGMPVIILGAGATGSELARILREQRALGFVPVGFFDDNSRLWGSDIEGVPVIGPLSMSHHYRHRVKLALIAMPGQSQHAISRIVASLDLARIIIVPDLSGIQTQWVTVRDLGGYLGLEIRKNLLIRKNWVFKRVLDYAFGLPGLLASLPLLAFLALWIKRASPGPAFYTQERIGRHGKPFRVWKLRTMHPDAEERLIGYLRDNPEARAQWESHFKLKDDPRIIPRVGHLLRRTSLDELPQFFNIVRGEMSLVGPRPFPQYHLGQFPDEFKALRSSVLPGLTGLWQVSSRSDGDLRVQQALDTYHIRNWSLWLDIYVVARTVNAVVRGSGAY